MLWLLCSEARYERLLGRKAPTPSQHDSKTLALYTHYPSCEQLTNCICASYSMPWALATSYTSVATNTDSVLNTSTTTSTNTVTCASPPSG